MEKELEKIELNIVRLKAALQQAERMEKVLGTDMGERKDKLLDQLSAWLRKRDEFLKK